MPAAAHRLLIAGLVIVLLLTAFGLSTTPVEASNWSSQIAATRRSQLAYESMMLGADSHLRSLGRALKHTRHKIKRSRRHIAKVRERRGEARRRLADTKSRLQATRRALREAETEVAIASIPTWSTVGTLLDVRPPVTTRRTVRSEPPRWLGVVLPGAGLPQVRQPGFLAALPGSSVGSSVGSPGSSAGSSTGGQVSPQDVRKLQRTARKQGRRLRALSRKTRRLERQKRARIRSIGSMKRQLRAAKARRAGAEAALKGRIVSMSNLAVRRAVKKTKMRPGRNTPFVWPVRGRISQGYGCTGSRFSPRRGSCAHFHDGLDIVAGHGAAIRSAGVGVISYVGRNPWDRGKRAFMVVVAHPGGYETLYGHVLPIRRVRVGQVVHRGEVIAYMGSTGHSTGTHLHLEFRRGYTTLNPLAFL